jgi:hypothetical protein
MGTENNSNVNVSKTASPIKRRTVGIIIVVIVVVVAVAAGVYIATGIGKGNSNGNKLGGTGNTAVSNANSLQFTISVTNSSGGSEGNWVYSAKNIGTSNLLMRIEYASSSISYIYIVNGEQQKVWYGLNGFWVDESSQFSSQLSTWNNAFNGYKNSLALGWAGTGDYTYHSSNGQTVKYTQVSVNPNLSDSLFTHT